MQSSHPPLSTGLRVGDACFLPEHQVEVVIADVVAGRYCCTWTERGVQRRAWVRPEVLQPHGPSGVGRSRAATHTPAP